MPKQKINCCADIFIFTVTENKVECATKTFKSRLSLHCDEIPENVVKQCINYIKKHLAHIYNASFDSSIVPNRLEIAK